MVEKIVSTTEFTAKSYEAAVARWGGKTVSLAVLKHLGHSVMPFEVVGTIQLDEEKGKTVVPRGHFSKVDPTQPFLLRISSPGDHYHFEGVYPTIGMVNPPLDATGVVIKFGEMLNDHSGEYFLSLHDLRAYCQDRRIPLPSQLKIIAHQYHKNIGRGIMMRENDNSILVNINDDSSRFGGITVSAIRLNPVGEIVYQSEMEHPSLQNDTVVQELFASYRQVESLSYLPQNHLTQWEFTVDNENNVMSHQFRHTIPKNPSLNEPLTNTVSNNDLFFDNTDEMLPFGITPHSGVSLPFLVLTLSDLTEYGPDYEPSAG